MHSRPTRWVNFLGFHCTFVPRPPSWIMVQATALRRLSSISRAQPKSNSKLPPPPDTGSGSRPHRAGGLRTAAVACLQAPSTGLATKQRIWESFGKPVNGSAQKLPKWHIARPPIGAVWNSGCACSLCLPHSESSRCRCRQRVRQRGRS